VQTFTVTGKLVRVFDNVGAGPQIISVNADGPFFVSTPGVNQVRTSRRMASLSAISDSVSARSTQ